MTILAFRVNSCNNSKEPSLILRKKNEKMTVIFYLMPYFWCYQVAFAAEKPYEDYNVGQNRSKKKKVEQRYDTDDVTVSFPRVLSPYYQDQWKNDNDTETPSGSYKILDASNCTCRLVSKYNDLTL